MQFIYHKDAGEPQITLIGTTYTHLFRARRMRQVESLTLRNLKDSNAYIYTIKELNKNNALLILQTSKQTLNITPRGHLIWAMIHPKIIEKTLPFFNECNLAHLTFFYAAFSQQQFKLDFARMQRILENSCEQCGRTTCLELELLPNLQEVLQKYPKIAVMDFGAPPLQTQLQKPILIGAEGGFSQNERALLKAQTTFGAPNCHIMRSESAAIYAISKLQ